MSVWKKNEAQYKNQLLYISDIDFYFGIYAKMFTFIMLRKRESCLFIIIFFAEVVCNDFIYILSCLFTTLAEMLLSYI